MEDIQAQFSELDDKIRQIQEIMTRRTPIFKVDSIYLLENSEYNGYIDKIIENINIKIQNLNHKIQRRTNEPNEPKKHVITQDRNSLEEIELTKLNRQTIGGSAYNKVNKYWNKFCNKNNLIYYYKLKKYINRQVGGDPKDNFIEKIKKLEYITKNLEKFRELYNKVKEYDRKKKELNDQYNGYNGTYNIFKYIEKNIGIKFFSYHYNAKKNI